MSFCNGPAFFAAARAAERAGKLTVPAAGFSRRMVATAGALGTGRECPSVRNYDMVDQDPSDNVTTAYLLDPATGRTAQDTAANKARMPGARVLVNGSDNALIDDFLDPALGCTTFEAPDLGNHGVPATSQALDELFADRNEPKNAALVPENDGMVLDLGGGIDLAKTNLYRSEIGQPLVSSRNQESSSPQMFCQNLINIQGAFVAANQDLLATPALAGAHRRRQPVHLPGGPAGGFLRQPQLPELRPGQAGHRWSTTERARPTRRRSTPPRRPPRSDRTTYPHGCITQNRPDSVICRTNALVKPNPAKAAGEGLWCSRDGEGRMATGRHRRYKPGRRTQLRLQAAGALLLAVSAGIHLDLYLTGYRSIPVVGWLFLVQVVVACVLMVAVLVTHSALAAAASAGFALSTLGAYLLAVWTGLFGFREIRTRAGIAAGLIEVAAFGVLALAAIAVGPGAAGRTARSAGPPGWWSRCGPPCPRSSAWSAPSRWPPWPCSPWPRSPRAGRRRRPRPPPGRP